MESSVIKKMHAARNGNSASDARAGIMDSSVIKKLADIDLAARGIIADAGEEKKKLAESYREQTEAFDRQVEEESESRLKKLRTDLEKENAETIGNLEAAMNKSLAFLEKNYAEQVDARADEIVARILEANEI